MTRVLGLHAIGIAVSALATLSAADELLQYRTRVIEQHVLLAQADGVVGGVRVGADGRPSIDYAATPISQRDHTFLFVLMDHAGHVLLRSVDPEAARLTRLRRPDHVRFLTLGRQTPVLATVTRPFTAGGTPLWLVVGWNLSVQSTIFNKIVRGFLLYSARVTFVVLLFVLAVDLVVMRRAFAPLLRVAGAVRRSLRSGEVWRLTLDELPEEILPLASSYNDALDKVEAAYALQRAFAGDAAHELRTPLAILRARLETLPADQTRALLLNDVSVMTRIVAQLLEMASLERLDPEEGGVTDPVATCSAAIEALAPGAVAGHQELGLSAPAAPAPHLRIRDQDLFQIVRNLVENAIRHTGPGARIDVVVDDTGLISVCDDGPGIPADLHAKVFERFWRRDRSDRSGAGLGLSIVQRLATRHGGTVTLRSGAGQGCRFEVRLPTASPATREKSPRRLPDALQDARG